MKKTLRKIIAAATTAAMSVALLAGSAPAAKADVDLGTTGTYGAGTYIASSFANDYFGQGNAFEVTYKYDAVAATKTVDGEEVAVDFGDSLEYVVYDNDWNGWQCTTVGPNGIDGEDFEVPVVGKEYTVKVPIKTIADKYVGNGNILGINLQTGAIDGSKITIISQKIVGKQQGLEFTATGSWTKGTSGTMVLDSDSKANAVISTNEWNIEAKVCVEGFTNPTVDVTVNYTSIPSYAQAEILVNGAAVVPNYVTPRKTGTMTYTTELPQGTTSFLACYDQCEVTKIHVYDNTEAEKAAVTGKTAAEINANLNPCWNLGNSLEAVDAAGNVNETLWGNPPVTQKTFQAVKAAGFNSVRIPVSYLNKVDANGKIDDAYLNRIQAVVDRAINSGLYVVIDIHNDGANDVTGFWLDISKTGGDFEKIETKFANMWTEIAKKFADYDQRLVFESMNEVMIKDCYTSSPAPAYANINALNQAFVTAVRAAGGSNMDRCLIIPGYNTDINLTAANYGTDNGFKVPADRIANRLILSVHFYDPYDFTLNMNSGKTSCDDDDLDAIADQFEKIANATTLPIFLGEYCALDKNNHEDIYTYILRVNEEARNGKSITLAYWDNGAYGEGGSALFDRQSNELTDLGSYILSAIIW